MITLHYATEQLFEEYGMAKPGKTVRAIIGVKDSEKVIGTVGVYADQHRAVLYADLTDELRKDKRAIVRGIRMMKTLLTRYRMPVHSLADPDIPGSRQLLEHIGFQNLTGDLYQWQP